MRLRRDPSCTRSSTVRKLDGGIAIVRVWHLQEAVYERHGRCATAGRNVVELCGRVVEGVIASRKPMIVPEYDPVGLDGPSATAGRAPSGRPLGVDLRKARLLYVVAHW